MKKRLSWAVPLVLLSAVSGAAFVAACNKAATANAATPTNAATAMTGMSVVDANGSVLGPLLGVSPLWSLEATTTYPSGLLFAFLDSGGHIWQVGGSGGVLHQPQSTVWFESADCSGPEYLDTVAPQGVFTNASGAYFTVSGSPVTGTANSLMYWDSAGCVSSDVSMVLYPVAPVTPPTYVAPLTVKPSSS